MCGLMLVAGMFFYTRLVHYISLHGLLITGLSLTSTAGCFLLAFYLADLLNVYVIVLPVMIMFLGFSFIFPATSTLAVAPFPEKAGMAGGFFGSFRVLGASSISALIAMTHSKDQLPMSIAIIGCSVLAWISLGVVVRNQQNDSED